MDSSCCGLYAIPTCSRTCFASVADRRAGCHVSDYKAIELSGRSGREAQLWQIEIIRSLWPRPLSIYYLGKHCAHWLDLS